MQRIKSQSTCLSQTGVLGAHGRPRSKKTQKGQTLDFSCTDPKNSNPLVTEQHQLSTKTLTKLSTGSLKNLRTGQSLHSTVKNSMQNTSRMGSSSTAISAKILKQIVGYSNRSSKAKQVGKDGQAIRLQIDLDRQIESMCTNIQKSNKKIRDKFKSHQAQIKNGSNSKNHGMNKKNYKKQQKIMQQMEGIPQFLQKNKKSISLCDEKSYTKKSFCLGDTWEGKTKLVKQQQCGKQLQPQHHRSEDDLKQFSSTKQDFGEGESQCSRQQEDKSSWEVTNQFMNKTSPTHSSFKKDKYQLDSCQKQGETQVINMRKRIQHKSGSISRRNQLKEQIKNKSIDGLLEEKQNLTISLEQSSVFIQERFELNYKQVIPLWKGLIKWQKRKSQLEGDLERLQQKMNKLINQSVLKKN